MCAAKKEIAVKNIGIDVKPPQKTCDDEDCPFHGSLKVRGQIIDCVVVSDKMERSIVVNKSRLHFVPKYERYEKRSNNYLAHRPPCMDIKVGDSVKIMECRPLAKSVSFVVIDRAEG